jgi:hypothetical protein
VTTANLVINWSRKLAFQAKTQAAHDQKMKIPARTRTAMIEVIIPVRSLC